MMLERQKQERIMEINMIDDMLERVVLNDLMRKGINKKQSGGIGVLVVQCDE